MKTQEIGLTGGIIFFIMGIYLAISAGEPHFYTPFSIGLFLIFLNIYNKIAKKPLLHKWKAKNYIIFFALLIVSCIIIDKIGIAQGYWNYPHYNTPLDEIVKYIFEWGIALLYIMLSFLVGFEVFKRLKINKTLSITLSLLTFVIVIGIFTEHVNTFVNSWTILKMPITNYKIGQFFLIFQTLGYWLMALITFTLYKLSGRKK